MRCTKTGRGARQEEEHGRGEEKGRPGGAHAQAAEEDEEGRAEPGGDGEEPDVAPAPPIAVRQAPQPTTHGYKRVLSSM